MPTPTPPRRWLRLLAGGLAAPALLAAAYAGLSAWLPPERLAAALSARVSSATGRSFEVRGPLSFRLLPRLGIAAADVALGNAAWGTRKEMLRVKQARFDIALLPLLRGRIDIASARFDGADLWLETDRNGVGNWVMGDAAKDGPAAAPAADGSTAQGLQLGALELRDARLSYRDGRSGKSRSLGVERLRLDSEGEGQRLDARLASGAQPLQLSGRIGRLAALTRGEADWPFDLQLDGNGLKAGAKGLLRGGAPARTLQADVSLQLTDQRALVAWVGPLPALPLPAEARGRLTLAGPALRIDGLQLSLAQQLLNGTLGAQTQAPWTFEAQLNGGTIDLGRWLPSRAAPGGGAATAPRRVFGDQPLGLESLPDAQGTLVLRADRVLAPGWPPLSRLNLQLRLQPGRVSADPVSFGLAGGSVSGSLALSKSGAAPPRLNLRAQAGRLSLDELLRAAGSSAYASGGQLQLRADLDMSGATPRALASGANGELLLAVNDTTLGQGSSPLGTHMLRRLLQALTLRPELELSSRIDCAVLRLPLQNGVAAIDRSIALETQDLAISAKGQVRFDDETLALAFTPTPRQGLKSDPLNLARLVLLKGPWRSPQVELDPKGVLGTAASLGLATATGGMSLIAQQMLQGKPQTEVCRVAMSAPQGAAAAAAPGPAPSASAARTEPLQKALPQALRRRFR
jgi:uncharacterized protein involved in outer membrane biogenesis